MTRVISLDHAPGSYLHVLYHQLPLFPRKQGLLPQPPMECVISQLLLLIGHAGQSIIILSSLSTPSIASPIFSTADKSV